MNSKSKETVTQRLSRLMGAAGIAHFTASEVLTLGSQHASNGLNTLPPLNIVHQIMPTLAVVDMLRDVLKSPIVILSGYRSLAYNRAIGGAKGSMHLQFRALDIQAPHHTPKKLHAILWQWREARRWHGGLGLYGSFVHIDSRLHNDDWTG